MHTLYERIHLIMLLAFQLCTVNVCLHFWQIVAVIQPLSQLTQSAVPWSPGSLLGSLPLPGSSSGNQQANLLFWLLLANSLQVCIPCKFTGMLNRVCLAWGTYHLLGKTGKFGWKIKWFVPFHLGSLRKVGQCSHQAMALQYPRRKI